MAWHSTQNDNDYLSVAHILHYQPTLIILQLEMQLDGNKRHSTSLPFQYDENRVKGKGKFKSIIFIAPITNPIL